MPSKVAAHQTASRSTDSQRSLSARAPHGVSPLRTGISRLQRAAGNQAVHHLLRGRVIQPQLTVGPVDDQYEREADRVADQVMRMPDTPTLKPMQRSRERVSRKCAACESHEEEDESDAIVQAKGTFNASADVEVDAATESAINAIRKGGQPLPPSARAFFEPRFGMDLGDVRVHTGSAAARTARNVNARAYTIGRDVVFGEGQYSPETPSGRALIAHELVHTLQQSADRRVHRFEECLPVTMQLGTDDERCPKREPGEESRSRSSKMFFWDLSNTGGWLIESFAIGRSTIKPSLRTNLRWLGFVQSMEKATDTRWEILGFSDCRGPEGMNKNLRKARAQAVFNELPASVQPRIDSADGALISECIVANTAEIGRAMNRSAFIRVTGRSFKGEDLKPRPKPKEPTPDTVDCSTTKRDAIVLALPFAIEMTRAAISAISRLTPESKALLGKYFGPDAVDHRFHIKQNFASILSGLKGIPKFECEESDSFFCDGAYAYVFPLLGTRIHICDAAISLGHNFLARTIVHEAAHGFAFIFFPDDTCSGGCPSTMSTEDAEDNADSYGEFAGDAYDLL